MGYLDEFKNFALKGSVVDLAVGVIIGAAFGKIVTALVENILMPPIGLVIGGVDFAQLRWIMKAAGPDGKGEVAIGYGMFLQASVQFLIVAFALFLVVRMMNRMKLNPAPAAATPEDVKVLREIRDLLKSR